MTRPRLLAVRLLPLLCVLGSPALTPALMGCTDAAEDPAPDTTVDAADDTDDTTAPADAPDADLATSDTSDAAQTTLCEGATIAIVTGLVHDDDGQPIEGARAQSCVRQPGDHLVCLRASTTAADGRFSQSVPAEARCMTGITLRALFTDSALATSYCPLALPTDGAAVISLAEPVVLHATSPATALPPVGDADAVRTVEFGAGERLELAPSAIYTGTERGYTELAMARLAPDAPGLCFDVGDATALVAFSPEADLTEPAALHLPNDLELAPGVTLSAEVLGGLDCRLADGSLVPEGTWAPFGTASVSADGTSIDVPGLPCLTWLRLRR